MSYQPNTRIGDLFKDALIEALDKKNSECMGAMKRAKDALEKVYSTVPHSTLNELVPIIHDAINGLNEVFRKDQKP